MDDEGTDGDTKPSSFFLGRISFLSFGAYDFYLFHKRIRKKKTLFECNGKCLHLANRISRKSVIGPKVVKFNCFVDVDVLG